MVSKGYQRLPKVTEPGGKTWAVSGNGTGVGQWPGHAGGVEG